MVHNRVLSDAGLSSKVDEIRSSDNAETSVDPKFVSRVDISLSSTLKCESLKSKVSESTAANLQVNSVPKPKDETPLSVTVDKSSVLLNIDENGAMIKSAVVGLDHSPLNFSCKQTFSRNSTMVKRSLTQVINSNPPNSYPMINNSLATRLTANTIVTNNACIFTNETIGGKFPILNFDTDTASSRHHEDSTVFDEMSMDSILDYLLAAKDTSNSLRHCQYIYVTPRYNIDKVHRPNFYDLVALDKPGHRLSSIKDFQRRLNAVGGRLMQLSLHGLLVLKDDNVTIGEFRDPVTEPDVTEFIPLRDFMRERQQVAFLRSGRFFGLNREMKTFYWWKWFTRRSNVNRTKTFLTRNTFFSEIELLRGQQIIAEKCSQIETNVELFFFHGKGAINIADFLNHQVEKIENVKTRLLEYHIELGDLIHGQYLSYMSSDKIAECLKAVKNLHPMKDALVTVADEKNLSEEWLRLRAVQRVSLSFREKINRLFLLAQFKFDHSVAIILERFWKRFHLFIAGISFLESGAEASEHWELDSSAFDKNGQPISPFFSDSQKENLNSMGLPFDEVLSTYCADGVDDVGRVAAVVLDYLSAQKAIPAETSESSFINQTIEEVRTTNELKIDDNWANQGCHAKICVHLTSNNSLPMTINEIMSLNSIEKVEVMLRPSRSELMIQVHGMCGRIGDLLEQLPSFRLHPFILEAPDRSSFSAVKDSVPELGIGIVGVDDISEENISKSSKYFTCLIVHPIFNSTNAYNWAVSVLNYIRKAYLEASLLRPYFGKLLEITHKLWYITPQVIAKQIERSLALNKMREFIDTPTALDDIKRLAARDASRMTAVKGAEVYLLESTGKIGAIQDIKFRLGFVASFQPALGQLLLFRTMQAKTFFERLPGSFGHRCRTFQDYLIDLEKLFSKSDTDLNSLILLMQRLKNFDLSRESFDSESGICESLFSIVSSKSKATGDGEGEDISANMLIAKIEMRRKAHSLGRIDPIRLYRAMQDANDRLLSTINRARGHLLSQVPVRIVHYSFSMKIISSLLILLGNQDGNYSTEKKSSFEYT